MDDRTVSKWFLTSLGTFLAGMMTWSTLAAPSPNPNQLQKEVLKLMAGEEAHRQLVLDACQRKTEALRVEQKIALAETITSVIVDAITGAVVGAIVSPKSSRASGAGAGAGAASTISILHDRDGLYEKSERLEKAMRECIEEAPVPYPFKRYPAPIQKGELRSPFLLLKMHCRFKRLEALF